jgi:hypothetical protein
MGYKTIKNEFPEYSHHENHMHELREKSKHNEKKMTEHIMGDKYNKEEYE